MTTPLNTRVSVLDKGWNINLELAITLVKEGHVTPVSGIRCQCDGYKATYMAHQNSRNTLYVCHYEYETGTPPFETNIVSQSFLIHVLRGECASGKFSYFSTGATPVPKPITQMDTDADMRFEKDYE